MNPRCVKDKSYNDGGFMEYTWDEELIHSNIARFNKLINHIKLIYESLSSPECNDSSSDKE